jgi:hypothetical protein
MDALPRQFIFACKNSIRKPLDPNDLRRQIS